LGEPIFKPGEGIGGFIVKFGPGLAIGVVVGGLILKIFPPPRIGEVIGGCIVKLLIGAGEGEREGAGEAAIRPKPLE
jgi:hypothetical protein